MEEEEDSWDGHFKWGDQKMPRSEKTFQQRPEGSKEADHVTSERVLGRGTVSAKALRHNPAWGSESALNQWARPREQRRGGQVRLVCSEDQIMFSFIRRNQWTGPGVVAHVCSPRYSGGGN
jgi:hypothetical protein